MSRDKSFTERPGDEAEASEKVPCPYCGGIRTHRRQRKGFMEEYVRPLLGYFPWRCGTCNRTFHFRKRNRKRSKKQYIDR